ncbi:MAG: hypothetical protein WAK01_10405 [Methylocystis sp.]
MIAHTGRNLMNAQGKTPMIVKRLRGPSLILAAFCAALIFDHAEAALPPKYLAVPNWRQCLSQQSMGSYDIVCLLAQRPAECPRSSWRALNRLDEDQRPPPCRRN